MARQQIVFIVDDEPMVRSALRQSIESLDVATRCFPTAQLCLEAVQSERCDLIISDLTMPGMDGLQLLAQARSVAPLVPVLIITGYGSVPTAVRSMHLGAADFVEKPLDEDVLLPKVRALLEKNEVNSHEDELSPAEMHVLDLVAEGKSNKEIAYLLDRSIRTVENHRHRLMKKLGLSSTADLVKFALSRKRG